MKCKNEQEIHVHGAFVYLLDDDMTDSVQQLVRLHASQNNKGGAKEKGCHPGRG